MRLTYTPPWQLTRWGVLPEYVGRINQGCDEAHNESRFIVVPFLGELIVWTGRKVTCDGECEFGEIMGSPNSDPVMSATPGRYAEMRDQPANPAV